MLYILGLISPTAPQPFLVHRRGERGITSNQQLPAEATSEAPSRQPRHLGLLDTTSVAYLGYKSLILFITSDTSAILAAMLFMVIEKFKDIVAIGERCRTKERMLPDGVTYHASWIDPVRLRCFQAMEAPHEESLRPWLAVWSDLVEFEIVPVVTSAEFWSTR